LANSVTLAASEYSEIFHAQFGRTIHLSGDTPHSDEKIPIIAYTAFCAALAQLFGYQGNRPENAT
jgi:hypothetical protein